MPELRPMIEREVIRLSSHIATAEGTLDLYRMPGGAIFKEWYGKSTLHTGTFLFRDKRPVRRDRSGLPPMLPETGEVAHNPTWLFSVEVRYHRCSHGNSALSITPLTEYWPTPHLSFFFL